MAFKMSCPKCGGLDYSIERDNRTFGAVAQAFELVYHCRCGKQMFGEQFVKEYERQKKEYEARSGETTETMIPGLTEALPSLEASSERASAGEDVVVDEARRRADEDRRWREKVQNAVQEASPTADAVRTPAASAELKCVWPGCDKPRRPNSKYCSRACSNKNARARHKARQKKGKKTAKSAAA